MKTTRRTKISVYIVGVDPGKAGALATLDRSDQYVHSTLMPTRVVDRKKTNKGKGSAPKEEVDPQGVCLYLERYNPQDVIVVLEKMQPRSTFSFYDKCPVCKRGKTIQSPWVNFSLGGAFWVVIGICAALSIPLVTVTPQKWKKYFGLPGGSKSKPLSRAKALSYYETAPLGRVKDEAVAEALLIARYHLETNESHDLLDEDEEEEDEE